MEAEDIAAIPVRIMDRRNHGCGLETDRRASGEPVCFIFSLHRVRVCNRNARCLQKGLDMALRYPLYKSV